MTLSFNSPLKAILCAVAVIIRKSTKYRRKKAVKAQIKGINCKINSVIAGHYIHNVVNFKNKYIDPRYSKYACAIY